MLKSGARHCGRQADSSTAVETSSSTAHLHARAKPPHSCFIHVPSGKLNLQIRYLLGAHVCVFLSRRVQLLCHRGIQPVFRLCTKKNQWSTALKEKRQHRVYISVYMTHLCGSDTAAFNPHPFQLTPSHFPTKAAAAQNTRLGQVLGSKSVAAESCTLRILTSKFEKPQEWLRWCSTHMVLHLNQGCTDAKRAPKATRSTRPREGRSQRAPPSAGC